MRYHTLRYYDPATDAHVTRYYAFDARGSEYFTVVPDPNPGKSRRRVRDVALDAIEDALADGAAVRAGGIAPGEVRFDLERALRERVG